MSPAAPEAMLARGVLIAAAGALGCLARAWSRDLALRRGWSGWSAVLAINLLGAAAMGACAACAARAGGSGGAGAGAGTGMGDEAAAWIVLAGMGFLGGWTTYSAFAVDVAVQWMRGERMRAVALACATLAGAPVIYVMVRAAVGAVG